MIGIICAMDKEIEGLVAAMDDRQIDNVHGFVFYHGTICGKPAVLCKCGVGKVKAAAGTAMMIAKYSPDVIINSGVAGGVLPLHQGDIFIADKSVEHDYHVPDEETEYFCANENVVSRLSQCTDDSHYTYYRGVIATGDVFVDNDDLIEKIRSKYNAVVFDMESAAVMKTCAFCGIPCGIIRSISDNGTDDNMKSFYEFLEEASHRSVSIMLKYMKIC